MAAKKIGIVYFDDIHIIPHFLGPLIAMYNDPDMEVEILTYEGKHTFLKDLLYQNNIPFTIVKQLPTYTYRKITEKLKKRKIPSPLYLFKKHKNTLLNDYDALIFNDINHEYLYHHKTGNTPKFVLLMHGAGDREYLIGKTYEKSIGKFDLITASGNKVHRFFSKMNLPKQTKVEICGYQKFDIIQPDKKLKLFDNNKPVVLYNPHFKPVLSSWYPYGEDILAFFYQNKDYNLIFAPHINLFNKKGFLSPQIIDTKYFKAPNIHIDLGTYHLVNMDYTLTADVYLGDVSSQIYEFMYQPRPAVFINTHQENWQNNPHYLHWKAGKVINNINRLDEVLATGSEWFKTYQKQQEALMQDTFLNLPKGKASENIKNTLKKILNQTKN